MTPTITPDILSQALNVAREKLGLDENEPIPTRTYDALIAFSHEIEWHKQKTAPAAAGVPENVARIPSDMVDGELSVASAIDQVVELFPSADRAALRTLAACLTHHSIHRYTAHSAAQPQAEQQPLPPCACHDHADAVCAEHSPRAEKAEQQGAGDVLPPLPPMGMTIAGNGPDRGHWYSAQQMQDYARSALAARQPADELALKQKVIDHMQQRIDDLDAELRAARQPVGEPAAWQINAPSTGHGWQDCTREVYENTLRTGRYMGLPAGTRDVQARALYTAPPAAVDLQGWSIHEDMHGPGIAVCAPNAAPGAMVVENKGPLAQRLLYALASALTDSKAVRS